MIATTFWILFALLLPPCLYLAVLAVASIARPSEPELRAPTHRFLVALAAHDEQAVIAATVEKLLALDYPRELFAVHVVADHCSDATADRARTAGATVHERDSGPRTGKGAALSWLFERILALESDAVVVFDADTQVAPDFLAVMDRRLACGEEVIQGRHVIRNSKASWFAALTSAMFIVDNRFQNQGRTNLGLSAKHMGDSICFRSEVLRRVGWGEGLTEDYQLRQKLLLEGFRITYEPGAEGHGEAALSWGQAKKQRERWIRGVQQAQQECKSRLLSDGLRRLDARLLDAALQAYMPVYSTLVLAVGAGLGLLGTLHLSGVFAASASLLFAWGGLFAALFLYPMFGLLLEGAPAKAYAAMSLGPVFIAWRTWLSLIARFRGGRITWVRTQHGGAA